MTELTTKETRAKAESYLVMAEECFDKEDGLGAIHNLILACEVLNNWELKHQIIDTLPVEILTDNQKKEIQP